MPSTKKPTKPQAPRSLVFTTTLPSDVAAWVQRYTHKEKRENPLATDSATLRKAVTYFMNSIEHSSIE